MTQYAFILSSGRTGTQFLAHYFDTNYEEVVGLHEPKPSYRLHILANAYADGRVPRSLALTAFRRWRQPLFQRYTLPYYVESNFFMYGLVDLLPDLVTDPFITQVVRDPREYIRSTVNHGSWYGRKWLASQLVPYWFPRLGQFLKPYRKPSVVTRFAALWVYMNTIIASQSHHPNYALVKFEDIIKPPYSGLRQIIGMMGLEYKEGREAGLSPQTKMNPSQLNLLDKWQNWSKEDCRHVQEICGPLMAAYGYGGEPEWLEKIK